MKKVKSIMVITLLLLCTGISRGQEIFDAVRNNDLTKVKELIEKDKTVIGIKDKSGNTPLHNASVSGYVPIVKLLLVNGADINAENLRMNTPLLESIQNGKDSVSMLLLEEGADINRKTLNSNTPLHLAALYNRTTIAELLIKNGADIEAIDRSQYTPLGLIARTSLKSFDVAKILVNRGANVNARDANGATPLENALIYSDNATIDLLLDHKAIYDTTQENLESLISLASGRGHLRMFKELAEKGGDSLFINEVNNRRLMRNAIIGGSPEIVKFLMEKNIPVDITPDIKGFTPLHNIAANPEALGMIEFLVKNGADINALTKDGSSAYNIAEANGNKEALSIILKLGGKPDPQKFPELTGPYLGQTPPGKEARTFAPGIVVLDHCTISLSPDGREIYWGTGTSIMMTKIENGRWTKPDYAPFSGKSEIDFYDDVPFVTPDNKKLFFTSRRPMPPEGGIKENIWFVERTAEGWSEPKPVSAEVNGMTLHWQVSVSNSGTLYFGGSSQDTFGAGDIYCSRLVDGYYTAPVNLGPVINSKDGESMPFIAPDESYILFYRVVLQRGYLHISFKGKDGQWMQPIKIDQIPAYVGVNVTSDGKYIFTYNLWASAGFIEELRQEETNKLK